MCKCKPITEKIISLYVKYCVKNNGEAPRGLRKQIADELDSDCKTIDHVIANHKSRIMANIEKAMKYRAKGKKECGCKKSCKCHHQDSNIQKVVFTATIDVDRLYKLLTDYPELKIR